MNLQEQFISIVKKEGLFSPNDKLLIAVSGGVDSVVLCELCRQSGFDFAIAHCNFQLRGEESERDEAFVKQLAGKYGVDFHLKKFDTEKYAVENKLSIQETARDLRYSWFTELVGSRESGVGSQQSAVGSRESGVGSHQPQSIRKTFLLTGHHADDNNETLLMNFMRGTGLKGLTAIPESSGHTRRPLLNFGKEELVRFANENKLDFVEDSSNASSKYTRNFFRNEIIPAIAKTYPQVKENLQDNITRFKEIEKLYRLAVGDIKKKLSRVKEIEVHIPVKQLMGYRNRALIYDIISGYGFNEKQVDELTRLAESDSGKFMQSSTHRIIKHRHWFIISPVVSPIADHVVIEENSSDIKFSGGTLHIEKTTSQKLAPGKNIALLDSSGISFPLLLRKWKTGDYFYPLGMANAGGKKVGKKKLARFFIDQKLSKTEKERCWVIESGERIIWVVGHRIDDRFKVKPATKSMLKITLNN